MTEPAEPTPEQESELLIAFLATHNAVCPLCGYELHLLRSPRCPECGRELRLTVGMVQPYLSAWIALLTVAAASAGFGLFCILLTAKDGWPTWPSAHQGSLNFTFAFHMLMVPIAIVIVFARRLLLRLRQKLQWILFAVVSITCVAMFAWFIAYVR